MEQEDHNLRPSNTRSSSNVERLQKLPRIRNKFFRSKKSFGMKFERVLKEGVIVVKSPMPYGHNGLHDERLSDRTSFWSNHLRLEAQILR
jgi:hypothetical protein